MIMDDSNALMIPQTPIIPQAVVKRRIGRPSGLHYHYKHGKKEMVIPLEEIIPKVKDAWLSAEHEAYFWMLYYAGCRASEAYELRCSQCTLTDMHFIIDFGQRKKHSAKTEPIRLKLSWTGVDKIVKLYNQHKDFRPTIKNLVVYSNSFKPEPTRRVIPTKDVWLFLNVSSATANRIVKSVLPEHYPHFLRLNRCTEIGMQEGANIIRIKSYSGIKSAQVIERFYLGQSKKELEKAEQEMDKDQPKNAPNIAADTEHTSS